MIADPHFALCSVRAENCSRYGQCARAQLAPRNVRQAYCTPNGRGDACRLFFDFQPLVRLMLTPAVGVQFRGVAVKGVDIADTAPSEPMVPGKTPMGDSANDGTASPKTVHNLGLQVSQARDGHKLSTQHPPTRAPQPQSLPRLA